MSVDAAIRALADAGVVFSMTVPDTHISIGEAARRLDCSVRWVREHKHEFPALWRMPGGELRIPVRDVAALAARNKVPRP